MSIPTRKLLFDLSDRHKRRMIATLTESDIDLYNVIYNTDANDTNICFISDEYETNNLQNSNQSLHFNSQHFDSEEFDLEEFDSEVDEFDSEDSMSEAASDLSFSALDENYFVTGDISDSEEDCDETDHICNASYEEEVYKNNNNKRIFEDNVPTHELNSNCKKMKVETIEERSERTKDQLSLWALSHGVPHSWLKSLLRNLNDTTDLNLPSDSRTLLKTPRYTNVKPMGSGEYCHFGLNGAVQGILEEYERKGVVKDKLNLTFNIDGLPIYKSSEKSLWLILCYDDDPSTSVYTVGIYAGQEKPSDSNNFAQQFIEESKNLCRNGFIFGEKVVKIVFHALICDAPAKSFVLCTKGHTGYYSCPKCIIRGRCSKLKKKEIPPNQKKKRGRVHFYSTKEYDQRTDKKFADAEYVGTYQSGTTIFLQIPGFCGVSKVPYDYMHLVLLGIVKKLLKLWLIGPRAHYKLSVTKCEEISKKLKEIVVYSI